MVETPVALLPIRPRILRPRNELLEIVVSFGVGEALADVLRGVVGYVKQQRLNWQIHCADADEFAQRIHRRAPDGAFTRIRPDQLDVIDAVRRSKLPIVNLLHNLEPAIPSVLSDDEAIGRSAAEYFLRAGFKSFAFLGLEANWSEARFLGFTQALQQSVKMSRATLHPELVLHYRSVNSTRSASRRKAWLRSLPGRTAVFVCCDLLGSHLLADAALLKLSAPDDVAVLGVDNLLPTCELAATPLSSIPQDFTRLGFESARLLHLQLSGKPREKGPVLLPPGAPVVRRSTDCLVFDDPHVSAAMRLIHQHAHVGLQMKELLRQVPVSRRWLDGRFKALIGHTPSEEIRRLRLEYIRSLLVQTDLSVKEIALRCGFTYGENMDRFFRDAYGVPPAIYRKQSQLGRS